MRPGLLASGLAAIALAADPAVQRLYNDVRAKVIDNARRVPRYTCAQTVNRAEYRQPQRQKLHSCGDVSEERKKQGALMAWRDRLHLEVVVIDGSETFAWAGARNFEAADIGQLTTSGSSRSGDFGSFLRGVFAQGTRISYLSEERGPDGVFGLFSFNVPVEASNYMYRGFAGGERVAAYHGFFRVDQQQAELRRLTVDADRFPAEEQMCSVEDVMDYHHVKIGEGDFLLPETTKTTVLFNDGTESTKEARYSNCREYVGEPGVTFGDAARASAVSALFSGAGSASATKAPEREELPPDLRLQIGLTSAIRSETAAAGDAVTGVLLRDVKDAVSGVVARKNDVVHGRILRLEQFLSPYARWVVAIRFDSLEQNGVQSPLNLVPRDDGDRSGRGNRNEPIADARPAGAGVFIFAGGGQLALDESFRSEWETR